MEEGKANNNNSVNEENPSNNDMVDVNNGNNNDSTNEGRGGAGGRRRPFTDLSQVDADLALARTLQEQERAYMMIRMNGSNGNGYGSWDAESYGHGDEDDDDFEDPSEEEYEGSDVGEDNEEVEEEEEEEGDDDDDAFDVHEHDESGEDENQNVEIDPSAYSSDEAYARALQDVEDKRNGFLEIFTTATHFYREAPTQHNTTPHHTIQLFCFVPFSSFLIVLFFPFQNSFIYWGVEIRIRNREFGLFGGWILLDFKFFWWRNLLGRRDWRKFRSPFFCFVTLGC